MQIARSKFPKGLATEVFVCSTTWRKLRSELETAKNKFSSGLGVDGESMDWLLAQVDFVVETIGNENLILDDFQRSELLELLLGVANLNECIHHSSATVRKRDVTGYPAGTLPLRPDLCGPPRRFKI